MSQSPYTHSCTEHPRLPCPAYCWAEEHQPDVVVCDEGTIWLFNPLSEREKAWVAEHAAAEPWQCLCVCRKLEKLTRLLAGADRIRAREARLRKLRAMTQ